MLGVRVQKECCARPVPFVKDPRADCIHAEKIHPARGRRRKEGREGSRQRSPSVSHEMEQNDGDEEKRRKGGTGMLRQSGQPAHGTLRLGFKVRELGARAFFRKAGHPEHGLLPRSADPAGQAEGVEDKRPVAAPAAVKAFRRRNGHPVPERRPGQTCHDEGVLRVPLRPPSEEREPADTA